jgi:hypothetical protein
MVDVVKAGVRGEVSSLLCEKGPALPADIKRMPVPVFDKKA